MGFFLSSLKCRHPEASAVIGLVRMHAYSHQGVLWLVDVPKKQAKKKRQELNQMGWLVTHTEFL